MQNFIRIRKQIIDTILLLSMLLLGTCPNYSHLPPCFEFKSSSNP